MCSYVRKEWSIIPFLRPCWAYRWQSRNRIEQGKPSHVQIKPSDSLYLCITHRARLVPWAHSLPQIFAFCLGYPFAYPWRPFSNVTSSVKLSWYPQQNELSFSCVLIVLSSFQSIVSSFSPLDRVSQRPSALFIFVAADGSNRAWHKEGA